MEKQRLKFYLPILFSLLLIAGIFLGAFLSKPQAGFFFSSRQGGDKLNDVINYIIKEYVDTISRGRLTGNAIEGMLNQLDPHSEYIKPEDLSEMTEPLQGNFEGVGIQFRIIRDTITVILPVSGGPSEKAGIRAGDRIVYIEGKKVAGTGITDKDVLKMLKGPEGTKVKVQIKRNGMEELLPFTITRGVIPTSSIDLAWMATPNIGYIKLSRFSATTGEEFHKSLKVLLDKGMKNLILDLRGNGGGYMDAAISVADEFLPVDRVIVFTQGKARKKQVSYATRKGIFEEGKLVVLIDEFSASASEIVAGALQDNDRALIIGRRSFGKGLVQEQLTLSDGSAIRLTVARYYTPSGRCIQKPYNEGVEKYYGDFYEQLLHPESDSIGDMKKADSAHKYFTLNGRTVFGGGGIVPDIWIKPSRYTSKGFLELFAARGFDYQFAFDYADKHRQFFLRFKNADDYINNYYPDNELIKEFLNYVKNQTKTEISPIEIQAIQHKLKNRLKAYIGRNLFDNQGFYPILLKDDEAFLKALENLK